MEEQLITHETAKLASEKGYSPILLGDRLPSQSLLQKWLYEEHQIWVKSQPLFSVNEQIGIHLSITSWKFPPIFVEHDEFDVYKGFEKGLQEALKLINKQ